MVLGVATHDVTEAKLGRLLELVTRENTAFFLDRLRAGQAVESAQEAGIRYCPDRVSTQQVVILDAATLLEQGVGSCGSVATYEAGRMRATAVASGTPAAVASGRFGAVLIRQPTRADLDYWHAVVRTPTGNTDPSRTLRQVCVTPNYA